MKQRLEKIEREAQKMDDAKLSRVIDAMIRIQAGRLSRDDFAVQHDRRVIDCLLAEWHRRAVST